MSQDFIELATLIIDEYEKGYVNHPQDFGGETKYGISKASYPNEDIPNLTRERALELYHEIWKRLKLDSLPASLRAFIFDSAILFGEYRAAIWLQEAVGVLPDGIIGPKTIKATLGRAAIQTLRLMFVKRALRHASKSAEQLETFGAGWFARLFDIAEYTISDIEVNHD